MVRLVAVRLAWLGSLAVLAVLWGCSEDARTEVTVDPPDAGDHDVAEDVEDAALEAAEADAPDEGVDAEVDATAAPVVVGLYPTPVEAEGEDVVTAQAEAVLVSLASGARAMVVEVGWEQLSQDGSWAHLETMASYLAQERKQVLLSIPVVEALADGRPETLQGHAWSSAAVRDSVRVLIDQVFTRLGPEVAYVSLGLEVDRYLEANPLEAQAFATFLVDALAYGTSHASRPEKTVLGVTWSTDAWLKAGSPERDALVEASGVVMLAHHGMNGTDGAQRSDEAVEQIRSAVEAVESEDRLVVLHRVASTTSALLGGSEADQAAFFRGVFELVQEKRSTIPFVGVAMLHDPSPESCFAFARAREPSGSAGLYAFWCSAGMRTGQGAPKESFTAFAQGASGFLSP
jgi:hypothetical protein